MTNPTKTTIAYSPDRPMFAAYVDHLHRMKKVKTQIGTEPRKIDAGHFTKINRVKGDFMAMERIEIMNNKLLKAMNMINRTSGKCNTFGRPNDKKNMHKRRFEQESEKKILKIEKENRKIGKSLKLIEAQVESIRPVTKEQLRAQKAKNLKFDLPVRVLKKYEPNLIKIPLAVPDQRKIFRPEIYFDMEIKGLRKMERLIFQLYTEACPQVVLEFVRICSKNLCNKVTIARLFPALWLEMDIRLDKDSIMVNKTLEYDKRVVLHDTEPGILSFPERYLNGFKYGVLCVDISFRPLSVLNGKRVAFGRLVRGKRSLDSIRDFGTRSGKLLKKIIIKSCGLNI